MHNIHYDRKVDLDFLLTLMSDSKEVAIRTKEGVIRILKFNEKVCCTEKTVTNDLDIETKELELIHSDGLGMCYSFQAGSNMQVSFLETAKVTLVTISDYSKWVQFEITYPGCK